MSRTQIALGTAQFGLNYGITNRDGQVSEPAVRTLLEYAKTAGISYLDTAQAYGNAEAVLGRTLPQPNPFHIISKLPAQVDGPFGKESEKRWQQALDMSLHSLKIPFLDGLLLHNASDLTRVEGQRLLDWLLQAQSKGLVRRIGVSIYDAKDLEGLPIDQLQLVQLPCSLYDQRLIENGTVKTLIDQGISLHARSLYLQGLLVTASDQWPNSLNPAFRRHHQGLEELASERNTSLVELALGWARAQSWLEAAVIGVTQIEELRALTSSWSADPPWRQKETATWAWNQAKDLDPRQWKL